MARWCWSSKSAALPLTQSPQVSPSALPMHSLWHAVHRLFHVKAI
jgi:hypothetical protein